MIDFGSAHEGVLLRDPAALEASLVVDSLENNDDVDAWIKDVGALYSESALTSALPHGDPKSRWAWLHDCLRPIRRFASEMESEPRQYAVAVAAALLFKASKDGLAPEPGATARAAACLFAERALDVAEGHTHAPTVAS